MEQSFIFLVEVLRSILQNKSLQQDFFLEDSKLFLQQVQQQNLAPFICNSLSNFPSLKHLETQLKGYTKNTLKKDLQLQASLLHLIDLSKEHNIPLLIFKGQPINAFIYGNANLRTSTDIDVLCEQKDALLLIQLLEKKGYLCKSPQMPFTTKNLAVFYRISNEFCLINPQDLAIDLHFKLFSNPEVLGEHHGFTKDFDIYLETDSYFSREYQRFSYPFTLVYLMVHGKKHAWSRLKWLLDVHLLLDKLSSEDYLKAQQIAQKYGLLHVFTETQQLCTLLFSSNETLTQNNTLIKKYYPFMIGKDQNIHSKLLKIKQTYTLKTNSKYLIQECLKFPARDMQYLNLPFKRILHPLVRPLIYFTYVKKAKSR